MVTERSITLFAPALASALARAMGEEPGRWPRLARLAGRGAIAAIGPDTNPALSALDPWQLALLRALGLEEEQGRYPDAAVRETAQRGEPAPGWWLHATPMHLAAGLDHLVAVNLTGALAVSETERVRIAATIAPHLQQEGFHLATTARGEWLLRAERALEVTTSSPRMASSNVLEAEMPRGPDARRLRRLMTELQMLLHEHAVNAERSARGAPAVNAIWMHGAGRIGEIAPRALPEAFGADSYLVGLYRLHGQEPISAAAEPAAVVAHGARGALAVTDAVELEDIEERWLPALLSALWTGRVKRIELVLDRWRLTAHRGALLKFWRRARPPARWAAW